MAETDLEKEALRISDRYVREVVIAFDLCPWAKGLLEAGGLERRVLMGREWNDELRTLTEEAVESIASIEEAAVAFLIFPRLACSQTEFQRHVSELERTHAGKHDRSKIPLAMAAFHPDARLDLESPHRLVSFLRRSPDPTIQLVRRDALASARRTTDEGSTFIDGIEAFLALEKKAPPVSVAQRIAEANWRTVKRVGPDAFETIFNDIARDRVRAYASCD